MRLEASGSMELREARRGGPPIELETDRRLAAGTIRARLLELWIRVWTPSNEPDRGDGSESRIRSLKEMKMLPDNLLLAFSTYM